MRHTWIAAITLAAAGLSGCGEAPTEKAVEPTTGTVAAPSPPKSANGMPGGEPAPGTKGDYRTDPSYPRQGGTPPTTAPAVIDKPPAETPKPTPEAPKAASLSAEETSEIAKLADPADQTLATAQLMCPVSAEHLGSMGAPIKKVVDGKTAFLCCKGCEKDFDKDPKPFLAKLAAPKP